MRMSSSIEDGSDDALEWGDECIIERVDSCDRLKSRRLVLAGLVGGGVLGNPERCDWLLGWLCVLECECDRFWSWNWVREWWSCIVGDNWWSEYSIEGGRRKSIIAFAILIRLPNAMIPISLLRRLTSSSRRTSLFNLESTTCSTLHAVGKVWLRLCGNAGVANVDIPSVVAGGCCCWWLLLLDLWGRTQHPWRRWRRDGTASAILQVDASVPNWSWRR
jgi:hypothetical protein